MAPTLLTSLAVVDRAVAQGQLVETPFGKAPRDCVVQHPDGSVISKTADGIRARHLDGTTKDYVATAACRSFVEGLRARRASTPGSSIANGWFTYAEGPTVAAGVSLFNATYTVPGLPATATPQVLYYFIGLQASQDTSSPILQPVLSYAGSSANPGYVLTSFVVASAILSYGSVVTGLKPGDTASASISLVSTAQYAVTASWNG